MKAVVLAGGKSTHLTPYIPNHPKGLIPIGDKQFWKSAPIEPDRPGTLVRLLAESWPQKTYQQSMQGSENIPQNYLMGENK